MVKFRMSMKSDKGDTKPHHISIPPKDAIAIQPPRKVIRALYDYQAPDSRYLSFSTGDFLHVVDREDDEEWYEACNPLQGSRGLVPVQFFSIVGKQARTSGGSARSDPSYIPAGNHDSGYADNSTGSVNAPGGANKSMRMSAAMRGQGAMVYGVVMYDFKAERPDELDAKEGEAIIVIAQSNPEWFVAKPITRLGGPGLIPVSFIEIRDMTTGKAVPNPQDAVRQAGVPKVEEWKKMAAEYKNGSIPLGKLDSGPQSMQQGMARMSLGGQQPQQQQLLQQQPSQPPPISYNQQPPQTGPGYNPQAYNGDPKQGAQLLAPLRALVPRYCFADDIFWFIVEAEMEDGRYWELSRLYQDFYDLQIALIQEYPLEAGNVKGVERSLPYMPGPVTYVTDNISNGRRANLDEYIRNLLKLGPHITRGFLVRTFFAPREGDYEIDPDALDPYRISGSSEDGGAGKSNPNQSKNGNGQLQNPYSPPSNYPPGQQQQHPQQGHMRNLSGAGSPPLGMNQYGQSSSGLPMQGTNLPPTLVKIKVWFDEENCVVIRMPPDFQYADLYKKLQERRQLEQGIKDDRPQELDVAYRDEVEGKLFRLQSDRDLQEALERNSKLTLNVKTLGR